MFDSHWVLGLFILFILRNVSLYYKAYTGPSWRCSITVFPLKMKAQLSSLGQNKLNRHSFRSKKAGLPQVAHFKGFNQYQSVARNSFQGFIFVRFMAKIFNAFFQKTSSSVAGGCRTRRSCRSHDDGGVLHEGQAAAVTAGLLCSRLARLIAVPTELSHLFFCQPVHNFGTINDKLYA